MKRESFNLSYHAHYLTFSCYRRQQLLTDSTLCRRLLELWDEARRKSRFAIWAYVIMPEHAHLLIWPRTENYEMARYRRALKEPFARWVAKYWSTAAPRLLERIKAQRGSRFIHRFRQEGGGYDRNLYNWESIRKAIEYIERNPVRRGLVDDPRAGQWSSARSCVGNDNSLLVVDPIEIE